MMIIIMTAKSRSLKMIKMLIEILSVDPVYLLIPIFSHSLDEEISSWENNLSTESRSPHQGVFFTDHIREAASDSATQHGHQQGEDKVPNQNKHFDHNQTHADLLF